MRFIQQNNTVGIKKHELVLPLLLLLVLLFENKFENRYETIDIA